MKNFERCQGVEIVHPVHPLNKVVNSFETAFKNYTLLLKMIINFEFWGLCLTDMKTV